MLLVKFSEINPEGSLDEVKFSEINPEGSLDEVGFLNNSRPLLVSGY